MLKKLNFSLPVAHVAVARIKASRPFKAGMM